MVADHGIKDGKGFLPYAGNRHLQVTRFGDPVAEVVPPSANPKKKRWVGSMAGTGRIVGDIVSPAGDEKDWEALNS